MSTGTLTVTYAPRLNRHDLTVQKVTLDWVAHTDGTVSQPFRLPCGILNRVVIDPGTPAPTALYDVTVIDSSGIDILVGTGANLSATATTSQTPLQATTNYPFTVEDGTHTLTIAAAGSGGAGQIILFIKLK